MTAFPIETLLRISLKQGLAEGGQPKPCRLVDPVRIDFAEVAKAS